MGWSSESQSRNGQCVETLRDVKEEGRGTFWFISELYCK